MLNVGKGLEHFTVPNTFLKLPLVSNISEEPHQTYNLPVQGQIHSEKLKQIIGLLEADSDENWLDHLEQIMGGNVIVERVANLTFTQYLDYLIHLCYANPEIDWNSISLLQKYLKTTYNHVSRWELPDLDFEEDLKSYYASRIPLKMKRAVFDQIYEVQSLVESTLGETQANMVFPRAMMQQLQAGNHTNISNFTKLVGNLRVLQETGMIKFEKFGELINELRQISVDLSKHQMFAEPTKRILYNVHFIMIYINENPDTIDICQIMLNEANEMLDDLDSDKERSYRWLVDATRAMIVNEVTKYNMEMVTEDMLLRSIGDRFLKPENTDLKTWMHAIETTNVPANLIILLIRGYMKVEQILHRYNTQLPTSETDNLVTLNNFIMSLLTTFDETYIINNSALSLQLPYYMEYYLVDTWAKLGLNQLTITPAKHFTNQPLVRLRLQESSFADYFEMTLITMDILEGEYPFDRYIAEIMTVEDDFLHLIGNEVFAKFVVDKFAKAFNYVQQRQVNGAGISIRSYYILIHFIVSWLPPLLKKQELIQDTIMLMLSFLKVLTNMVQAYFSEKGKLKTAKLWDLNYTIFELNLFCLYGYPKLDNINKILNREHIFDDFLRLLRHFDLDNEITTVDKRYLVLDQSYDTSKFSVRQQDTALIPKKLHEHNIMEYLELRNTLDTFLKDIEDTTVDDLTSWFQVRPFDSRDPSLNILDKIKLEKEIPELSYPFIKPINAYAAAIQFFDLDIELPDFGKSSE